MNLSLACGRYDRTQALIDGRVRVEGVEHLTYLPLKPGETFWRQLNHEEFDASEMSLSSYAILRSEGDTRFVALPVFPSRVLPLGDAESGFDIGRRATAKSGVSDYQMTAAGGRAVTCGTMPIAARTSCGWSASRSIDRDARGRRLNDAARRPRGDTPARPAHADVGDAARGLGATVSCSGFGVRGLKTHFRSCTLVLKRGVCDANRGWPSATIGVQARPGLPLAPTTPTRASGPALDRGRGQADPRDLRPDDVGLSIQGSRPALGRWSYLDEQS
jgi:hypothetical protein